MDYRLFAHLPLEDDNFLLDIHTAASIGCDERIRDIIENSENKCVIDQQNKAGWTPLMYGACCANLKVVLLLLEEGARANLKNKEGHTALSLASKCGSGDVVNLLIDSGANINDKDDHGWTALFHAVAYGHRTVVQLLIERGAVVDISDHKFKVTPLMLAAAAGHEIILKDLLQLNLNVDAKSSSGDTARSLAAKNGHLNVTKLLDAYGYSKEQGPTSNSQCSDLFLLLKQLQLTKYYHIFDQQDIDIHTFFLLTDEDLKEIGIQLLGPRKKMCVAISQYQHQTNEKLKEKAGGESMLIGENKMLLQLVEKLKSEVSQEKNQRIVVEKNFADAIQNFKKYSASVQGSVNSVINLSESLKEHQEYFRSLLYSALQSMNISNSSNVKIDFLLQSLDCIQQLIEIQYQNSISLQKISSQKFYNK